MKLHKVAVTLAILLAAAGCRSRVIRVRLVNSSPQPVSTIIVDYPGATFGVNSLAPGKTFLYVIKPLETGPLKVQFTNAQGVGHSYSGPTLHKNQEGTIEIKITQDSASADAI
jgi:hypothetical protein